MHSTTPIAKPKLRRRWLRFSVRGLLLAVTVLCVWLAWHVDRGNRQRDAAAAVRETGGAALYDYEADIYDSGYSFSNCLREPSTWERIEGQIGREYCNDVVIVDFTFAEEAGKGIESLDGFPRLRWLHAPGESITDDSLDHIAEQSRLEQLHLRGASITDDGLQSICRLRRLSHLSVAECDIGDVGVRHIAAIRSLRHLNLCGTRITDAGLRLLRELPSLEALVLRDTDITDAGIGHLAAMRQLHKLSLEGTRITNAAIDTLKTLPSLDYVALDDTAVTSAAAEELARAFPDAMILANGFESDEIPPELRERPAEH